MILEKENTEELPRFLPNFNLNLYFQELLRQNYIAIANGDTFFVTADGKALFEVKDSEGFELFWTTFPSTDAIPEAGIGPTRVLRSGKDQCKKKFNELSKEYSSEEIIELLKYEIEFRKKKASLKYMKNSKTWLNNKEFENYRELKNLGKNDGFIERI